MPDIYQLKVTLLETKPPIWRRLLVPTDLILGKLHDVLQIAMGWHDEHLYEFHVGKQPYGRPNPDDQWFGFALPTINDRKVRLDEVLPEVRSTLVYTYDMGDSWEHSVVVEKRLPADPAAAYPVCIGGERACPPEDIGGIPGFYRFMELLLSSDEIEREGAHEWVEEDWDPEAFPIDDVNRALQPRRRKK
jgi:hypothetical protein